MKVAEKVGFVVLFIGLIFVVLAALLAFLTFTGMKALPQLIPQGDSDLNVALANTLAFFAILAIITWVGSIITSRGVTLIKEINLKVLRESFGIEAEQAEEEKNPSIPEQA